MYRVVTEYADGAIFRRIKHNQAEMITYVTDALKDEDLAYVTVEIVSGENDETD